MTKARAAFIEELQSRAPSSVDGALLSRAAAYLIGDEQELYDAFVAEAAAQREAERPDLTAQHRGELDKAHAAATAARESLDTSQEQADGAGAGTDSGSSGEAGAEKAGKKTRKRKGHRAAV